jgi:hypothetical protein
VRNLIGQSFDIDSHIKEFLDELQAAALRNNVEQGLAILRLREGRAFVRK